MDLTTLAICKKWINEIPVGDTGVRIEDLSLSDEEFREILELAGFISK